MLKTNIIILLGALVFLSSCEKNCEKDKTWLNPDLDYNCVKDRDGNKYATIKIGDQTWMAENLKTNVYANGDPIPNVTNGILWDSLTTGAWAHYNNDIENENPYGKLYNWYAVVDQRNICPKGWHVPTNDEWRILINNLDPTFNSNSPNNQSYIAGSKMKSTGTQYWLSPNLDATNESGFSGVGGHWRDGSGEGRFWCCLGGMGFWWSSTENFSDGWMLQLDNDDGLARMISYSKKMGVCVRCLMD
jgi:uncharacterized protein (TIGR02145 family)